MTWTEWSIVAACAILGYWLVSLILDYLRKPNNQPASDRSESKSKINAKWTVHQEFESVHAKEIWIRENWHVVLGVSSSSTLFEIKHAYRTRIQKYHPDRVEGLAPELVAIAEEKSKELNIAYETALTTKS